MFKRHIIGLAVLSVILLVSGILEAGVQEEKPLNEAKTIQTASSYDAKVSALRDAFAAERESLGLSNTTGQLSTPESDLGEPECRNAGGGSGGGSGSSTTSAKATQQVACPVSSKGAPVWMVNMVNLNFYMADTPLWYRSPIGPSVEMKLGYNSQSSLSGRFGNKWQLNYGSYLYPQVNKYGVFAGIMIIMPGGKEDLYVPAGSGGYTPPYQVFNTLTEVAANHFELKFPDGRVYVYNIPPGTTSNVSLLVEMQDAYGQKLSMGYNAEAKLTTITDALGKVTTLSYNSEGLVIQATDPFGRFASFEYDANRNLTKITDMGGYWTSFTYRHYVLTDYYLASLTNAGGSWGFYFEPADGLDNGGDPYPAPGTAMGYNSRLTVTEPSGGREEYYRGSSNWHVSPKNYIPYSGPDSNNYASNVPRTVYTYTMTSRYRGEVGSIASPEGNTTTFAYEDVDGSEKNTGNNTGMSNGLSHFSYSYNPMGKITSITDSYNTVTNLIYAANGVDLTGITNGLGTIALTYNGAHDITSSKDRSGNTKTITHNGYGKIISMADPLGITTNFIYDSNHLLVQITRSGQTLESYTYDPIGRIQTYIDATGMTRTYEYNSLNDITKITYPDGRYINITYSNVFPHLIASITDRAGLTTQYVYNASKEITQVVNPEGGIIGIAYDTNGNRIQLIDPNGQFTGFDYDKDNRRVRKIFADGTFASYTYDGVGRLASFTNARNLSANYLFDLNDNLSRITYTVDFAHYTYPSMFQYDPYRRLTAVIDDVGTTAYDYNADSLLTSIDGPLASDTFTFQHDAKGRMTGYSLESGQSVSFNYDAFDRLTEIGSSGGVFSYSYSGASPLIRRLTRPNGSYTEYQHDSLNRLIRVANKKSSGETINQYEYAYNAQDLRSTETIINGAPIGSLQTGAVSYSYNNVNALLSSTNPNRTFAYDADGNMTQWDTPAGKTFTGVYDIESRLLSAEYEEIISNTEYESYKETYKYRSNGIMAEKDVEYSKVINYPAYEYYQKTVKYVAYGLLPLQERDENDNILREYTWGPDLGGGIGGLLSLRQGGQDYYYLYDGEGNVTALIDGSQSVAATYAYDPFGKLMAKTGTLDQPYQFSTKPYDEKTGLSYYGYRFYSPSIGRWMTRDPLGEEMGLNLYGEEAGDLNLDEDGLFAWDGLEDDGTSNLYEFVGNNPINWIDPLGLKLSRIEAERRDAEETSCKIAMENPQLASLVVCKTPCQGGKKAKAKPKKLPPKPKHCEWIRDNKRMQVMSLPHFTFKCW